MTSYCPGQVEQIVQYIASTMLDVQLEPIDAEHSAEQTGVVSSIQICGGWDGVVELALSEKLAQHTAQLFFGVSPGEVGQVDEQEVAAELVNIIGGNLKGLLPGPSKLSLPTLVSRTGQETRNDANLVEQVVLVSEFGPMRVTVFAKDQKPAE